MIHSLKPYQRMKDSGVPWVGQVPEHWDVRRLKYVLRERDSRSADGWEQLLRVSQYTGGTKRLWRTVEERRTRGLNRWSATSAPSRMN